MRKEFFNRDMEFFIDHRVDWPRYFQLRRGDEVNPQEEVATYKTILHTLGEICEAIEAGARDHWHEDVQLIDAKSSCHTTSPPATIRSARPACSR